MCAGPMWCWWCIGSRCERRRRAWSSPTFRWAVGCWLSVVGSNSRRAERLCGLQPRSFNGGRGRHRGQSPLSPNKLQVTEPKQIFVRKGRKGRKGRKEERRQVSGWPPPWKAHAAWDAPAFLACLASFADRKMDRKCATVRYANKRTGRGDPDSHRFAACELRRQPTTDNRH